MSRFVFQLRRIFFIITPRHPETVPISHVSMCPSSFGTAAAACYRHREHGIAPSKFCNSRRSEYFGIRRGRHFISKPGTDARIKRRTTYYTIIYDSALYKQQQQQRRDARRLPANIWSMETVAVQARGCQLNPAKSCKKSRRILLTAQVTFACLSRALSTVRLAA